MLVHIGYSNSAMAENILAVLAADGSTVRRLRSEAKDAGRLIDATAGGRTRSLIIASGR